MPWLTFPISPGAPQYYANNNTAKLRVHTGSCTSRWESRSVMLQPVNTQTGPVRLTRVCAQAVVLMLALSVTGLGFIRRRCELSTNKISRVRAR